jgi:hypothetical protein
LQSDDLDAVEQPQILHPYKDNPSDHLEFEYGGVITGTSSKGKKTIEVCDLADEELRKDRQRAQENKCREFGIAYIAKLTEFPDPHAAWEEAWKALHDVEIGKVAYSAAIRAHLSRAFPPPQ